MPDSGVAYGGEDLHALKDLENYPRWVIDLLGPSPWGRTIEIGAGTGNLTRFARERCAHMTLLEPSPLAGELQDTFAHDPDVEVVRQTSTSWLAEHPDLAGSFDTVFSVNVLEHIEDDIAVLRDAFELLRPGGTLRLAVPALPALLGSLDESVGHLRRYRRRTLRAAVQGAGFSAVELRYFDLLGVAPWFVAGRILRRRTFDTGPAVLFDRLAIPVGRWAEDRLSPPLGKNLACVARR